MNPGHRTARRMVAALVAVAALAAPAQAGASSAGLSGGTLSVTSGAEASALTVTPSGSNLVVADANGDVGAGSACQQTTDTPRRVTCPAGDVTAVASSLGDGADSFDGSAVELPATVDGGSGDDRIATGAGDDTLAGGAGSDVLRGGGGTDTADYSDRLWWQPVFASLNGKADDGGLGEGDTIAGDVENVTGGASSDLLTGDGGANVLRGGPGNDSIDGDGGSDSIDGGTGDDRIAARDDFADAIACGAGSDSGLADAADTVAGDCEAVDKSAASLDQPPVDQPPAQQQPPAQDPPATQQPVGDDPPADDPPAERTSQGEAPVEITTKSALTLSPEGDLTIGIACTADSGTCKGTVELIELAGKIKARSVVAPARRRKLPKGAVLLGRRNFAIRAGRKKSVRMRLARNGRQRIIKKKKKRKTRARLVITVKAPDGTETTTEKNVTISPPKRGRR